MSISIPIPSYQGEQNCVNTVHHDVNLFLCVRVFLIEPTHTYHFQIRNCTESLRSEILTYFSAQVENDDISYHGEETSLPTFEDGLSLTRRP